MATYDPILKNDGTIEAYGYKPIDPANPSINPITLVAWGGSTPEEQAAARADYLRMAEHYEQAKRNQIQEAWLERVEAIRGFIETIKDTGIEHKNIHDVLKDTHILIHDLEALKLVELTEISDNHDLMRQYQFTIKERISRKELGAFIQPSCFETIECDLTLELIGRAIQEVYPDLDISDWYPLPPPP